MIGAAIGLASNAISGIIGLAQMNKANKQIQTARNAQTAAMNEFKNIREQNPFAAVQVNTGAYTDAANRNNQFTQNALESLGGAGAEGVLGGASKVVAENQAGNLDIASQLGQAEYDRDVAQATAQGDINQRQAEKEGGVARAKLNQAVEGQQIAEANKQAGFEGLTQGVLGSMEGISGLVGLYGKNRSNKNPTQSGATQTTQTQEEYMNSIQNTTPFGWAGAVK